MPRRPDFVVASSIDEAIGALEHYGEAAKVVAGATAVTIMLQRTDRARGCWSASAGIHGLGGVERDGGALRLGALSTHREVELDPLVRRCCPSWPYVRGRCQRPGPECRHRGRRPGRGGLRVGSPGGLRASTPMSRSRARGSRRSRSAILLAFYETALEPDEIVTAVVCRSPRTRRSRVREVRDPSSEDRPCVGVAAVVPLMLTPRRADLRVAVGAAAETPQRFPDSRPTRPGA